MDSEHFKTRTKRFALDVVCFCSDLPRRTETRHVIGQLQRCATSVAANYRAACRGKSKPDFVAKPGTVEEEADESAFWLEFIKDLSERLCLDLGDKIAEELERLRNEANQLLAMTVASKKTARANL